LGEILFIVGPIAGISLEELSKEILPFILVEVTALLVITYFPFFTLYVPQLLGYVR